MEVKNIFLLVPVFLICIPIVFSTGDFYTPNENEDYLIDNYDYYFKDQRTDDDYVEYVNSYDFSGGTYAKDAIGVYAYVNAVAHDLIGFYSNVDGTMYSSEEKCYGVYVENPSNCAQSFAGHFNGDVNITGTLSYGALQANSPHLLGEDPEVGYTRMIVTADNGVQLMQYWHYDEKTGEYVLKAEPLEENPGKYEKAIEKYNTYKDKSIGKKQETELLEEYNQKLKGDIEAKMNQIQELKEQK